MTTYFDTEEAMKAEREKADGLSTCGFDADKGKWFLTVFKEIFE